MPFRSVLCGLIFSHAVIRAGEILSKGTCSPTLGAIGWGAFGLMIVVYWVTEMKHTHGKKN